jgi:hypothetical protein
MGLGQGARHQQVGVMGDQMSDGLAPHAGV